MNIHISGELLVPTQGGQREAAHGRKHLYKRVIPKDTFPGPAFRDSDQ